MICIRDLSYWSGGWISLKGCVYHKRRETKFRAVPLSATDHRPRSSKTSKELWTRACSLKPSSSPILNVDIYSGAFCSVKNKESELIKFRSHLANLNYRSILRSTHRWWYYCYTGNLHFRRFYIQKQWMKLSLFQIFVINLKRASSKGNADWRFT